MWQLRFGQLYVGTQLEVEDNQVWNFQLVFRLKSKESTEKTRIQTGIHILNVRCKGSYIPSERFGVKGFLERRIGKRSVKSQTDYERKRTQLTGSVDIHRIQKFTKVVCKWSLVRSDSTTHFDSSLSSLEVFSVLRVGVIKFFFQV